MRKLDIGLYLDEGGEPAGIKLFSDGKLDERLTTDSMGQFHFTRWRNFPDIGWKVDASMALTMQGSHELTRVIRNIVVGKDGG
jgi:hypothetical protein